MLNNKDITKNTLTCAHLGTDPLKLCSLVSFRTPFTMDRDLARIPSLFDLVPATVSTSSCLSVTKCEKLLSCNKSEMEDRV